MIHWVVITLAVIGATGVGMAIWEEIGPRLRRDKPGRALLVQASVPGYRTGRLDRILAGDFDRYGDAQSDR